MSRRLIERTEGRRKGYKRFESRIGDRVPADVREKLEAMRRGERVNPDRKESRA